MIKAYQQTMWALVILLTILLIATPVRADNESTNRAIGLGVGLLATGIEMLSQHNRGKSQPTTASKNSKITIKYSKKTANVQSSLKDLGFYNGSIDGLKGQQTYRAIEAWRQSVNSEDTGEINIYEVDVLNDRAKTARENNKYKEKKRQHSSKTSELPLENAYYSYASNEDFFELCNEFKNSNHELSYSIDDMLEINHKNVKNKLSQEIDKTKKCLGISAKAALTIKERAYQKYKNSRVGQVMDIALKLGPHVFVNEQDVYSRIEGCNAYSRTMKLLYQNLKNKPITCDTVK